MQKENHEKQNKNSNNTNEIQKQKKIQQMLCYNYAQTKKNGWG